ncbi:AcrR family transcriptional regulator [Nocardia transvalensis]|uniref:AcrR family transcriptional regulator n=1 Tax=Nocardia transvalensis TaxID=37333 RepID=A0A7W9PEN5_9NOCA|nr:TetR/AcrR family transcriptional regulator [Nocardia transvalensis]MBB5914273.1 AcrR family transcriptional regulator [Nocardia transvalensis]
MALSLIDAEGLEGFSMRRLGRALGADPMAAYRHFTDQQDLFDEVAASIFAELAMDELPWHGDWHELMRAYGHRLRSALRRHPNAVPIFATRPIRSPQAIATGNRMIARLRDAGFPPPVALQVSRCLGEYVSGHMLSWTSAAVAATRSRKPEPDAPGYDLLAAAADGAAGTDHFDLGLTAMLDGFDRYRSGMPSGS